MGRGTRNRERKKGKRIAKKNQRTNGNRAFSNGKGIRVGESR